MAGLVAALAAAAVDVAGARDLARYAPDGGAAFYAFLAALYAAVAMPLGGLAGPGLAGLV